MSVENGLRAVRPLREQSGNSIDSEAVCCLLQSDSSAKDDVSFYFFDVEVEQKHSNPPSSKSVSETFQHNSDVLEQEDTLWTLYSHFREESENFKTEKTLLALLRFYRDVKFEPKLLLRTLQHSKEHYLVHKPLCSQEVISAINSLLRNGSLSQTYNWKIYEMKAAIVGIVTTREKETKKLEKLSKRVKCIDFRYWKCIQSKLQKIHFQRKQYSEAESVQWSLLKAFHQTDSFSHKTQTAFHRYLLKYKKRLTTSGQFSDSRNAKLMWISTIIKPKYYYRLRGLLDILGRLSFYFEQGKQWQDSAYMLSSADHLAKSNRRHRFTICRTSLNLMNCYHYHFPELLHKAEKLALIIALYSTEYTSSYVYGTLRLMQNRGKYALMERIHVKLVLQSIIWSFDRATDLRSVYC